MGEKRFDPRALGRSGEDRAARWYVERGYELLARNWRCREGEIDLILATEGCVVFAEVKTRATSRFGTPFEAVDARKQGRLRQLAGVWLAQNRQVRRNGVRFDVVAVIGTKVEVRQSAF